MSDERAHARRSSPNLLAGIGKRRRDSMEREEDRQLFEPLSAKRAPGVRQGELNAKRRRPAR
ncbi:MAG: hypothetical protein C4334_13895 [Pyrinomonas sp.]